jgi:predicted metal-dependent phosphoesterase TrpH
MGYADLHIHSNYSLDGLHSISQILRHVAQLEHVNVIAITDHDVLRGSLECVERAPRFNVQAIPGMEITTADGHLLAYFIQHPIPAGRPLLETLARIGEQGGLAILPHPMRFWGSHRWPALREALNHPEGRAVLVGIEVIDAWGENRHGVRLAAHYGLACCGNSDAHVLEAIGQTCTQFPDEGAISLREALTHGQVRARLFSPPSVYDLALSYARTRRKIQKEPPTQPLADRL